MDKPSFGPFPAITRCYAGWGAARVSVDNILIFISEVRKKKKKKHTQGLRHNVSRVPAALAAAATAAAVLVVLRCIREA